MSARPDLLESRDGKRTNVHSKCAGEESDAPASWLERVRGLPLWRPLALPLFRRLWAGSALSLLADQAFLILFTLLVLRLAGPGAELGAILAVAAVPGAVLLPIGGWVSDRVPPSAVMAATTAGRMVLMAALAALVLFDAVAVWQLSVLGGLLSALDAFYYPASMAIVPALVSDERLEPANALVQGMEQMSGLVGPALAAGAVAAVGLGPAFRGVAVAFALAALAYVALARGALALPRAQREPATESGPAAILAGARYAWGDPVIRALMLILAALNVAAAGPLVVGGAALATERFGGAGALGIFFAVFGAGSLLGTAAAGTLGRPRRRGIALLVAAGLFGVGLAALGLAPGLGAASVIAVGMGAAAGYLGVVLVAWLQERAEPAMLGRVMSLVVLAAVALDPVSYAATGALLGIGLTPLFAISGGLMALTALLAGSLGAVRALE